jgi:hypothetical protein
MGFRKDFRRNLRLQRGFSLGELLLAMSLAMLVLGGAVALFRQGVNISYTVTQRAEMQQNSRAGMNMLARDLSIAGTDIPAGGIGLPSGPGSQRTRRACPAIGNCGVLGIYLNDRLFSVTPGDGLGPVVNGVGTDAVTLLFIDDSLGLGQNPLVNVTPSGDQMTVDPAEVSLIHDPAVGLVIGDVLLLTNIYGAAIGVVTTLPEDDKVNFAASALDPLNVNQPSAAFGNIASLSNPVPPGPAGVYPPTRARRINVVSYFIDAADPNEPKLMRQVNGHPAVPVALDIENLQISYDIVDTAGMATADLGNPASPNQIRKVNLELGARSPLRGLFRRGFERVTLATSVSIRNLGWFDRYPGT